MSLIFAIINIFIVMFLLVVPDHHQTHPQVVGDGTSINAHWRMLHWCTWSLQVSHMLLELQRDESLMKVLLTSSSGATMVLQPSIPSIYLVHLSFRSISIAVQKLGCNSFTHCAKRKREQVLQRVDRVLGQLYWVGWLVHALRARKWYR